MEVTAMLPIKERLPFAIRFANLDLEELRRGDWFNLFDDVIDFVGFRTGRTLDEARRQARRVGVSSWPVSGSFSEKMNQGTIRALQAELRQMLNGLMDLQEDLDGKQRGQWPEREAPPQIPEIHIRYWLNWQRDQDEDAALFHDGSLRDLFLSTLVFLLARDVAHVRRCPECKTIFYRVRKQRYCNRTCTNRANMRDWRQTEKAKQGESDLNHARYKTRVQRRLGANVSVGRRPRSGGQQKES
jgi:hypothetical protein